MEVLNTVKVESLVAEMNQNIFEFIVENVDTGFDIDCENSGYCADDYFESYDKNKINKILAGMKKKELKKVAFAGAMLYKMVMSFGFKINQNAFYFLSFLDDIDSKAETAMAILKTVRKM